jgi:DNA-binding transcriptional ArsR family regulator
VRRALSLLADEVTYVELSGLFGALADGTRVKLVHVLLRQELCTCDLAATLGVSESATSQHLRLLRALRLVKSRRAGKVVYHSLDDEHIEALVRVGLIHLGHTGEAALLTRDGVQAAGERIA